MLYKTGNSSSVSACIKSIQVLGQVALLGIEQVRIHIDLRLLSCVGFSSNVTGPEVAVTGRTTELYI